MYEPNGTSPSPTVCLIKLSRKLQYTSNVDILLSQWLRLAQSGKPGHSQQKCSCILMILGVLWRQLKMWLYRTESVSVTSLYIFLLISFFHSILPISPSPFPSLHVPLFVHHSLFYSIFCFYFSLYISFFLFFFMPDVMYCNYILLFFLSFFSLPSFLSSFRVFALFSFFTPGNFSFKNRLATD